MLRTLLSAGGLVALFLLLVGCDSRGSQMAAASKAAAEARAAAEKAEAHAKEAAEKGAAAANKRGEGGGRGRRRPARRRMRPRMRSPPPRMPSPRHSTRTCPKIQEKINGLSGDAKAKAQTQYDELKKTYEEAKASAPDKWEVLKSKAMANTTQ